MYICNNRMYPKRLKIKPKQCMKCWKWGHFTTECNTNTDTCRTCRGEHYTKDCTEEGKCHVRPCDLCDQRTCAVTLSGNSRRTSGSYRYVREVTHSPGQSRAEEGQLGLP